MATIEQNIRRWDNLQHTGAPWSERWGGEDMEWYFTILPRIHRFIPAETILEIGPGHGRWTNFLAGLCKKLITVDVSPKCIEFCRKRFENYPHITCHVNDGKSLDMIADGSVDFIFSFDSLVHAEEDVVAEYLNQLSKKMKSNSAAFIHHSNAGAYKFYFSLTDKIPAPKIKELFIKLGLIDDDIWRALSMTAGKFKLCAERAGLVCVSQEVINWGKTARLIDCFSVVAKKGSDTIYPGRFLINKDFIKEVKSIRRLSCIYGKEPLKQL